MSNDMYLGHSNRPRMVNLIATAAVIAAFTAGCGSEPIPGDDQPRPQVTSTPLTADAAELAEARGNRDFITTIQQYQDAGFSRVAWENAILLSSDTDPFYAVEVPLYKANGTTDEPVRIGLAVETDQQFVYIKDHKDQQNAQVGSAASALIAEMCCNPTLLCDYPIQYTIYWACVNLEAGNLLGNALLRQRRYGYTCNPSSPQWYANWCGDLAVCHGVETSSTQYYECVDIFEGPRCD